jgi:hypothetical protein
MKSPALAGIYSCNRDLFPAGFEFFTLKRQYGKSAPLVRSTV